MKLEELRDMFRPAPEPEITPPPVHREPPPTSAWTSDPCSRCGSTERVARHPSRTAYQWDGEGRDPNAPIALCPPCAQEYNEDMDDMWAAARGL